MFIFGYYWTCFWHKQFLHTYKEFCFTSYTVELNDDAGLALIVTIVTICDPRAVLQYGAFELAGTLGEVFQTAAVLLDEVLIRFTLIILLGLD